MAITPNYGLTKPVVGADTDAWGTMLNGDLDIIDTELFKKASSTNPIFTGSISAPMFIGTPSAILRPTVDANNAIQFQNAAGTMVASVDTIGSRIIAGTGGVSSNVFYGANFVQIRPITDANNSIQFQNATGAPFVTMDTSALRVGIGGMNPLARLHVAVDQPRQLYLSSISDTTKQMRLGYNTSDNTCVVEGLLGGAGVSLLLNPAGGNVAVGSSSVARFTVSGASTDPNLSADTGAVFFGYSSGVGLSFGSQLGSPYSAWIQTKNAGNTGFSYPLAINPLGGFVGIGQSAPSYHLEVSGSGTAQDATFTPSNNINNSVLIQDSASGVNNGGALILGAANRSLIALRASLRDGSGFGAGFLSFFVRSNAAVEAMTMTMRLDSFGNVVIPLLPAANPGAGTKALYYDPADGNRVKFSA